MILEYLFLDESKKKEIKQYTSGIKNKKTEHLRLNSVIKQLNGTSHWTIKYEISGNNIDNARALSEINDHILAFNPITLTNESSEYFNKVLYPLVNKFERYLRKFLYLKWSLYTGDKLKKIIANLEQKDFGEIFKTLFVDDDFCVSVKKKVNNISLDSYTKRGMIESIKNIEEHTLWDEVVGNDILSYVRDNFIEIKNYRNDIMHAHNFGYKHFLKAKSILEKAVLDLEKELNKIDQDSAAPVDSEKSISTLYNKLSYLNNIDMNVDISQMTKNWDKLREIVNMMDNRFIAGENENDKNQ